MDREGIKQFIKYLAGGNVYFWVGYGLFALCYTGLRWEWLPSKLVADATGITLNYFTQRHWTFKERHHLREIEHMGRYVFIETVGFFLDYALIGGLNAAGITPYIGFFISAGFFSIWSWCWYKYWVFPDKSKQRKKSEETVA